MGLLSIVQISPSGAGELQAKDSFTFKVNGHQMKKYFQSYKKDKVSVITLLLHLHTLEGIEVSSRSRTLNEVFGGRQLIYYNFYFRYFKEKKLLKKSAGAH